MDAETFYINHCRDFRCENVTIKCIVDGVEKYIPSYMFSF